jgi:hypothetical protein
MSEHAYDIEFDADIGSPVRFSIAGGVRPDVDPRRPRHHRGRHRASRHRADDTGSLRIVRHRRSTGRPDDAGHEVVAHALLVGAVGAGALTVAQLSLIAMNGLASVVTSLQTHLGN